MYGKILAITSALLLSACANSVANEASNEAVETSSIPADQQAFLNACEPWDEWDKPAPPFKVHANTYYVGTCGIASILISDEAGHIIIDSGTEGGADVVIANVKALGFEIADVRILLSSHEHFDHVGGMAKLQAATGAAIVTSQPAAAVLATGQIAANDPQFGSHEPFDIVPVGRIISTGQTVTLAGNSVRAIETPGHSPGALSWAWQECAERCENIVYADSLSPISRDDYKFSDNPTYLAAYRAGLELLRLEDCQILLTPHPSHSRLLARMEAGHLIQNAPDDDPCRAYADGKLEDIESRLREEANTE
ncbi:MAG: subclass B3 metallo-beta-lactamase [Erythrobacter sp.]